MTRYRAVTAEIFELGKLVCCLLDVSDSTVSNPSWGQPKVRSGSIDRNWGDGASTRPPTWLVWPTYPSTIISSSSFSVLVAFAVAASPLIYG